MADKLVILFSYGCWALISGQYQPPAEHDYFALDGIDPKRPCSCPIGMWRPNKSQASHILETIASKIYLWVHGRPWLCVSLERQSIPGTLILSIRVQLHHVMLISIIMKFSWREIKLASHMISRVCIE